jgi:hypothetical protein
VKSSTDAGVPPVPTSLEMLRIFRAHCFRLEQLRGADSINYMADCDAHAPRNALTHGDEMNFIMTGWNWRFDLEGEAIATIEQWYQSGRHNQMCVSEIDQTSDSIATTLDLMMGSKQLGR